MVGDTNSPAPVSQRRLRRLTAAILAAGFAGAIIIYISASPPPPNPLGYDPLETKKYVHDLELYGGKANVLAEEFREWFVGLWRGRNLAFTVAVMTVLIVLVVRFFATPLPPAPLGDAPGEADSAGPDS
ncbi:MAG TPA: hypothetical protein VMR54_01150 [Thermoanaerobaculia bacterium]|nr:hypothetical protein [Thermoanaerobaculia bacterium]